jgi:hypothetical protein
LVMDIMMEKNTISQETHGELVGETEDIFRSVLN